MIQALFYPQINPERFCAFPVDSFAPQEVPDYTILSHRWGQEEVTFKDIAKNPMSDINSPSRKLIGFSKIEGTCRVAKGDGYDWVWIDSCCI